MFPGRKRLNPALPSLRSTRRDRTVALGTGVLLVLIAFLGADKPPPPGFLAVPALAALLAVLIAGALPHWRRLPNPHRLRRPAFEGAITGLGMWLIAVLLPFSGESTVAAGGSDYLIGATVAAALGAAVAAALARIAS